jgi:hypothetical protein
VSAFSAPAASGGFLVLTDSFVALQAWLELIRCPNLDVEQSGFQIAFVDTA